MKRLILFMFSLLLSFVSFGQNNHKNFFVDDQVNFLSAQEQQKLTQKLKKYEDETTTQINIVIINTLNGQNLETYSYNLAKSRGIGQKEKNNGILVLVVKQDKRIRIEVGYGLEAKLSDASCKKIINQIIKPKFRNKTYYQGLNQTVDQIISIFAGNALMDDSPKPIEKRKDAPQITSFSVVDLIIKIVNVWLIVAYILSFMHKKQFQTLQIISVVLLIILFITEVSLLTQIENEKQRASSLSLYVVLVMIVSFAFVSYLVSKVYSKILRKYNKKVLQKKKGHIVVAMIVFFTLHILLNFLVSRDSFYLPFYLASFIIYLKGYEAYYNYYLKNKAVGKRYKSSSYSNTGSSSYSSSSYSSYNSGGGGDFGGGGASGSW